LRGQLKARDGPDFEEMKEKNDTLTVKALKSAVKKRRMRLLHLLRKHKWSLPLGVAENKELQDSADYLCKAHVLWERERPNVVVPVHRVMRKAIEELLDESPEDEGSGGDREGGA